VDAPRLAVPLAAAEVEAPSAGPPVSGFRRPASGSPFRFPAPGVRLAAAWRGRARGDAHRVRVENVADDPGGGAMNGWLWLLLVAAGVLLLPPLALALWLWRSGVSRSQAAAFLRAAGVDLVRLPGRLRRLASDPRVPRRARWWLIGLAIYVASPIDPIPDFIPIIGLVDEAVLVPIVLIRVKRMIDPDVWAEYFPPRSAP